MGITVEREESKEDVEAKERIPPPQGFKLLFHFVENPYFTNDTLEVEYQTFESNPYNGMNPCNSIKSSTIHWKDGMDLTTGSKKKTKKNTNRGKAQRSAQ